MLTKLFQYYDKHCFDNKLMEMLQEKNRNIVFSTNLRGKHKAGEHGYDPAKNQHTIKINTTLIDSLDWSKSYICNGIEIKDRLSAIRNIFEHELVHLYINLIGKDRLIKSGPGKNMYTPHGTLFQETVKKLFGHTDFRHMLSGQATQTKPDQLTVGQTIKFSHNKEDIGGQIIRINKKTCTVVCGNDKYRVPFGLIRI